MRLLLHCASFCFLSASALRKLHEFSRNSSSVPFFLIPQRLRRFASRLWVDGEGVGLGLAPSPSTHNRASRRRRRGVLKRHRENSCERATAGGQGIRRVTKSIYIDKSIHSLYSKGK